MLTDTRFRDLARLEEDLRSLSPVEIDQFTVGQATDGSCLGSGTRDMRWPLIRCCTGERV